MSTQHVEQILPGRQLITLRLIVAGALFSWCLPSFASATPKPTIVYPTGVFPTDGINVQAAADKGGTVLLKATNRQGTPTAFNFGTPDPNHAGTTCRVAGVTVNLNVDVAILGEQAGQHMTTINGGCTPILGLVPVSSKIEGIDFEAPVGGCIVLVASTGTEIVGNRINGVIGSLDEIASGLIFTYGDAIDLFGNDGAQNSVTGHAIIANNVIENLGAEFAIGVQLDGVSAEVDITGNTVRYPQSNGDVATVGIAAFRSHSRVYIVGNDISMGPGSLSSYPAPISIGGDNDARYIVAFNRATIDHPNGDGIIVTDGNDGASAPTLGAEVFGNRVSLNSSSVGQSGDSYFGAAGIDVYGAVNDSLIVSNVILGTSAFAFDVAEGFDPTATSDSDQFVLNDISEHTSLITDVYFATNTSNLLFVGRCATDINLGVDNNISCGYGAGHSLGLERSGAVKARPNDSLGKGLHHAFIEMIRGRSAQ